jgi:DNA-binding FadR family transcriptional regulator
MDADVNKTSDETKAVDASNEQGQRQAQGQPDLFSPINRGRISGVIIDRIRQLIHSGELMAGARLPSERDLCTQFGVSRVTVREALRVLESSGLVEIRVGARGGAFVTAPSSERIGAGITDLLALSGLTAVEVTEARQLMDLGIVPLACERATAEDIEELFALCTEAEEAKASGELSLEPSADFHIRLAQATHNGAIAMIVQSFREPILMSLERAREAAPLMGTKGDEEHRALVEAIRDRDTDGARRIMATHLSRTLHRVADPSVTV